MANTEEEIKWDRYGCGRLLSRNRLLFTHHQLVSKYFISFFAKLSTDLKVLDVGCGDGFFLEILRNLGFSNIEGIDLGASHVKKAQAKGLAVTIGSIFDMHCAEQYDVVLCMEVLEHLDAPEKALTKIRKSLKKGGILFLSVPISNSLRQRWHRIRYGQSRLEQIKMIDETHVHAFTLQELSLLAERTGFNVLQHWVGSNPFPFGRFFSVLKLAEWLQTTTLRGTCGDCLIMVLSKP